MLLTRRLNSARFLKKMSSVAAAPSEHHIVNVDKSDGTVTLYPKKERAAHSATVVFSHGLGDSARGSAAGVWGISSFENLDHVKFILPTATNLPVTINGKMPMPAWYDIEGLKDRADERYEGLNESKDRILKICENELEGGIAADRIVLAGFSQGAALSLYSSFSFPFASAGVICMSGYLPHPNTFSEWHTGHAVDKKIPVRFFHGEQDTVVDIGLARDSCKILKANGVDNLALSTYPALQHNASEEELEHVAAALLEMLPPCESSL